jgi:hypothetical protein
MRNITSIDFSDHTEDDLEMVLVAKDLVMNYDEDVLHIIDTCLTESVEDVVSMRDSLEKAWPKLVAMQFRDK